MTNELPSRLEESLKALADLLMGKIVAAPQAGFAACYRFNETLLFLKIPRQHVLKQLVRIAPMLGGRVP